MNGHLGEVMDTSSYIAIGTVVAAAIGTVCWYWIRGVQSGISSNGTAIAQKADKTDLDAVKQRISDLEVKSAEEHAAMKLQQSQFEAECARNFVSNPALLQAMGSLDRTIQQLTQVIQTNAEESRAGIKAINERIDNLMLNRAA